MKIIRKLLVKTLGIKTYLGWVSKVYISLIAIGFSKSKYAELYFTQKILREGDIVLDIGANLSYYSYFLAKRIGKKGHLYAIEPIPLFADIWKKNMRKYSKSSITLFNCALGSEEKEFVNMSIPIVNGVVRHGLTKVDGQGEDSWGSLMEFKVPMHIGDLLLKKEELTRLNYLKCDVEGYEQYVIPSLEKTISTLKPLIQIELNGKENRENVVDFLIQFKYDIYLLADGKFNLIERNEIHNYNQDFYFINRENARRYYDLIKD
jgi:FkbM family methyltransferase